MVMNICIGYNEAYKTKFYADCEMVSQRLNVGDTYKGEEVEEVSDFVQPKESHEEHVCQMVTTMSYHEIVIIQSN